MSEPHCIVRIQALCGESPLWSPAEGVLYWIDCLKPAIYRYDPATGQNAKVVADLPDMVFGLALRAAGGLVLVASDGISFLDPATGTRSFVGHPEAGRTDTLANDGACDRLGRFWFGTSAVNERDPAGSLYRLDPDLSFHKVDSGIVCANGPAFDAEGSVMYFADSGAGVIFAYDLDSGTGLPTERRLFASVPSELGVPDGMTVGADGCLLSAHFGGARITRYRPDGSIDRVIDMPVPITTSCAFGGPDLKSLFITTGSVEFPVDWDKVRAMDDEVPAIGPLPGALYSIGTDLRGVAETAFAG